MEAAVHPKEQSTAKLDSGLTCLALLARFHGKAVDTAYLDIARLRAGLREAATLIPDFPAYENLCAHTIQMAWESDRTTGKRTTHNLKMSWLRLFPYFASCQRLHADLKIRALNRAGDYACVLAPKTYRGPQWARFVKAGKAFGIYPNQLEHLVERSEKRMNRQGLKHHDALHATR